LLSPVWIGKIRVQDHEQRPLVGPVLEAEPALIATGEKASERIVTNVPSDAALIGCIDQKVGARQVSERNPFRHQSGRASTTSVRSVSIRASSQAPGGSDLA
jgi:hypothetical protein